MFDRSFIPFDPYVVPGGNRLQELSERVHEQLESLRPTGVRQPRADGIRRRSETVSCLAANLVRTIQSPSPNARLIVQLMNEKTTRYDRPGVTRDTVREVLGYLEELGVVHVEPGQYKARSTTVAPTQSFRDQVKKLGGSHTLRRVPGAECIVMRAHMGRRRPKKLIDYEDTDESRRLRFDLETINEATESMDLRVWNVAAYAGYLTRHFRIPSYNAARTFHAGGRVFGGSWMNLPKSDRYKLSLAGEALVDLDYRAMFAMLAYQKAGHGLPPSDPYSGVNGLERGETKMALLSLLCRTGPMKRLPEDLADGLYEKGWTGPSLEAALRDRHPEISPLFGTGVGLELMRLESDILIEALLHLTRGGIHSLPMHDGMMVAASGKQEAIGAMEVAAEKVLGVELQVVEKPILKPSIIKSPV